MSKRWVQWIAGLFVFTAVLGLGYTFRANLFELVRKLRSESVQTQHRSNDQQVIELFLLGEPVDELKLYPALVHSAQSQSDVSQLKRALELAINHQSTRIRQAAARALGSLSNDWAVLFLQKSLADLNLEVRLTAIDALKRSRDSNHIDVLKTHFQTLSTKASSKGELAAVLAALSQMTGDKSWMDRLVTLAKSQDSDPLAIQKLVETTNEAALLKSTLAQLLAQKTLPDSLQRSAAAATIKLANMGDETLRKSLSALSRNESASIRRAAIQSLHRVCPKDVWSIIVDRLQNESDPNTGITAVESAALLETSRARTELESFVSKGSVTAKEQVTPARRAMYERAKVLLQELQNRPSDSGACRSK